MMIKQKIRALGGLAKVLITRIQGAYEIIVGKKGSLDQYSNTAPHPQNILDLFKGEWVSKFPSPFNHLNAGNIDLFNDSRLDWALNQIGDISGKTILELGPLEGAHAYTLQKQGASSVISIEANPRAYLRCLAVKQILKLNQVEFLYGDFIKYLHKEAPSFDLCVACGVLYHMHHPVELISKIAHSSDSVFIWTHYYDPVICKKNPAINYNFKEHISSEYQGFKHTLHKHNYRINGGKKFYGGPSSYSNWLSRQDILDACKHFGFKYIKISDEHDTPNHVHGPAFAFIASKKLL